MTRPFLRSLHRPCTLALAAVLAVPAVSAAHAQRPAAASVSTIALTAGGVEFPEPFTEVTGLHELRDGRVLLLDNRESSLQRIDFAARSATPALQRGGGPTEAQFPIILIKSPGDRPVIFDARQARLLFFDAAGTPTRTVSLARDPMAVMELGVPIAQDHAGRLYAVGSGFRMPAPGTRGEPRLDDSVALMRFVPGEPRRDTLAILPNPASAGGPRTEMTPGGVTLTTTAPDGSPTSAFTVLSDGRVAQLADGTYQVRFLAADGTRSVGPLLPGDRIPVTPAMRRAALDSARVRAEAALAGSRRLMESQMASMGAAGASAQMPTVTAKVLEPASWATTVAPYAGLLDDGNTALWVAVPSDIFHTIARYDVLDGSGALVARVTLASGEHLAKVTTTAVYTTRKDADDLVYLKRYPLPAALTR